MFKSPREYFEYTLHCAVFPKKPHQLVVAAKASRMDYMLTPTRVVTEALVRALLPRL